MINADQWYDAIVISNELDPNRGGAVKVNVYGVTDGMLDRHQPFAVPRYGLTASVPQMGQTLSVRFEGGDPNRPYYTQQSSQVGALPKEFVGGYPNVSVSNLGESDFRMIHDRSQKLTRIEHPSGMSMTVNGFGTTEIDSDYGYGGGPFPKNPRVLTEDTIDIFTCTPVGGKSGVGSGAYQGSEYLTATQMSRETFDRVAGAAKVPETILTAGAGADTESTRSMYGPDGNKTGEVVYLQASKYIDSSSRKITGVLVIPVVSDSFGMLLAKVTAQSLPFSAHYLVGLGEDDAADPKFGFYQCVDIDDIAMAGASSKLGDVAANLVCVSVYVLDSGGYTDYQYATVSSILSTVRKITGNPGIMLYGSDSVIPPIPGGKPFDAGKVSK